ncbi:F0F1 ATP synthase subunit B [Photobacterium salinisoli]|uniref:F0F1 ATP synthase subunit B family protein n=1 Tax=Photobacterium salinisoli TaxID=1616783 RepID=UPI000EA06B75|nr:F0F1 ATP synthase subunit B [Photobacterium salinisoli]
MLIDWFTVSAQIINFLILVWLLKRFLYRPILNAIDEREQRIASELADADAVKIQAEKVSQAFQQKQAIFDKERAQLLSQAKVAANQERLRLLEKAREEALLLSAKRQENLESEARELRQEIGRRMQQQVFAIARKVLADLADVKLEERITSAFVARLQALSTDEKCKLASALRTDAEPIVVRSAFELPSENRLFIETQVRKIFGTTSAIRFATAPEMVSGIELSTDGQKVAWSIEEYLKALEHSVDELIKATVPEQGVQAKDNADES